MTLGINLPVRREFVDATARDLIPLHLDSAVRQVANETGDREPFGYVLGGKAEADPLNPAGVVSMFANRHTAMILVRPPAI